MFFLPLLLLVCLLFLFSLCIAFLYFQFFFKILFFVLYPSLSLSLSLLVTGDVHSCGHVLGHVCGHVCDLVSEHIRNHLRDKADVRVLHVQVRAHVQALFHVPLCVSAVIPFIILT